ncbi:MAG: hypothetical protein JXE06_02455 [Coriobacteriia bacterium]|nr:hypothetical protein [Coriobacteriia bacterium]
MAEFNIETLSIADLKPHPRNSRKHDERQLTVLERRFTALGWYKNVVVARWEGACTLLAGHGVVIGAQRAGQTTAPCHVRKIDPQSPEAIDILEGDNTVADLAEDDLDKRLANLVLLQGDDRLESVGFDETTLENLKAELQAAEFGASVVEPGDIPDDDEDFGDAPQSDTRATIGPYRFDIDRGTFLNWEDELREKVGFDEESIIAEIRRRLGL